jgi:hypothetical protein
LKAELKKSLALAIGEKMQIKKDLGLLPSLRRATRGMLPKVVRAGLPASHLMVLWANITVLLFHVVITIA